MNKKQIIKSLAAGSITGIVNGIFGAGGGLVLVPLLINFIKLDTDKAMPTSVAIIFPMCLVSSYIYFSRGDFDINTLTPYLIGGLIGGIIGGITYKKIPKKLLRRSLGIIIIYSGIRAIFLL